MPAKNKREKGQKGRRDREAKLPPEERHVLLNEYSQTRGAVAARARRPREDQEEARRRKQRVQGRLTHRDAAGERLAARVEAIHGREKMVLLAVGYPHGGKVLARIGPAADAPPC